ncbi:MAG: DUF423 domain-containing protein [Magnetococcales bacterium]|nr:DUF423 domain-containing protein [Magnetococcales bacterium]
MIDPSELSKGKSSSSQCIFFGSILAGLAVALGAFGKHVLLPILSKAALETWHTGAYYQLIHGMGIILAGLVAERAPHPQRAIRAGRMFLVGSILFSGSLCALALTGAGILGVLTPLGGLCFLGGWMLLAWSVKPGHPYPPQQHP